MKNLLKLGVLLASLTTLLTSVFAATDITGVWHGKVSFDTAKLPPTTDPNQRKDMAVQVQKASAMAFTLTLKSDHTFVVTSVGGTKKQSAAGTWKQVGNSITIKPVKGSQKTFTVSGDMKSLGYTQGPLTMAFSR